MARASHGLVYDSNRDVILTYGGATSDSTKLGDTWEFNGATWIERSTNSLRSGNLVMAYDATRGMALAFFGAGAVKSADVYLWNGDIWTIDTSPEKFEERRDVGFAYSPDLDGTLMFGGLDGWDEFGDTWLWTGAWSPVTTDIAPEPRAGPRMVYDPVGGQVLLHGGCVIESEPSISCTTEFSDTWSFRDGNWTKLDSLVPSIRATMHFAIAHDFFRGVTVRFGGYDYSGGTDDRVHEWNGSTWIWIDDPGRPSKRGFVNMAYLPAANGLILFGGSGSDVFDETWRYGCSP